MKRLALLGLLAAGALPCAAGASDFGLDAHAGTLGLGAELNYTINPYFTARVNFNNYTYSYDSKKEQIDYNFDLKLSSYAAMVDVHPFQGIFRVTGGLVGNNNKVDAVAVPSGTYTINGTTYSASQVGTLSGLITFNSTAPYLGLGWSSLGSTSTGLGFSFDVGVLMQGSPKVKLSANGPIANNSQFQSDLAAEQAKVQDDVNSFKTYPVIALGLTYRF
ncbi:MAG TPA: hypothetical protein VHP13_00875 [Gammaproteobacteria bacterium]|jgi:hypothetical protein|nr:hypothetical protein [Gammaproteobacteria bacterium]